MCPSVNDTVKKNRQTEATTNRFLSHRVPTKDTISINKVHNIAVESGAFIVEGHSDKYTVTPYPSFLLHRM